MRPIFFRRLVTTAAAVAVVVTTVTLAGTAAQAPPLSSGIPGARVSTAVSAQPVRASTVSSGFTSPCPPAAAGDAGCAVEIGGAAVSPAAKAAATTPPSGLSPANIQQAYNLQSSTSGMGQTVAVVTPYDDPDLASDLAAYRSQYGLTACTAADGCLREVSETDTTTLPPAEAGWDVAEATSVDMISAVCPNCHITVVEATSATMSDLGTAENEAVTLGADFIDNDWFTAETADETSYDGEYFDHPGVAITAPGDDDGYGDITYPAASSDVIAVGGTVLTADSSQRGYNETAWPDTNSGCSAFEPKPSWQTDTGCTTRSLNDISADAGTPVAYYDTPTAGSWSTDTGTGVAAAIVAAAYALAGTPGSSDYPAEYPYEHPGGDYTTPGNAYPYATGLNNITSGSNGTCSVTYLCTAGNGYNGPTGLGSPNRTTVLTASGGQSGFIYAGEQSMCLNDAHDTTTAGTEIEVYTCEGAASEKWTAEPDGTIRFSTATCMTVTGGATSSGSTVELDACDTPPAASQTWIPGSGATLYNPASGLCLYDPGATTSGTSSKSTPAAPVRVSPAPSSGPSPTPSPPPPGPSPPGSRPPSASTTTAPSPPPTTPSTSTLATTPAPRAGPSNPAEPSKSSAAASPPPATLRPPTPTPNTAPASAPTASTGSSTPTAASSPGAATSTSPTPAPPPPTAPNSKSTPTPATPTNYGTSPSQTASSGIETGSSPQSAGRRTGSRSSPGTAFTAPCRAHPEQEARGVRLLKSLDAFDLELRLG